MEIDTRLSANQIKECAEIMKAEKLTNDDRVFTVCKVIKRNLNSFDEYICFLKGMNKFLASGVTLDKFISFLIKNKYEGMEEMPIKMCELELGNIKDVTITMPKFDEKQVKDVIFNNPATIVFWKDGTKTVVKCQKDKGDTYNPELGLAMCIIKKMCGNKGNYNNVFNKWLPKEEVEWNG